MISKDHLSHESNTELRLIITNSFKHLSMFDNLSALKCDGLLSSEQLSLIHKITPFTETRTSTSLLSHSHHASKSSESQFLQVPCSCTFTDQGECFLQNRFGDGATQRQDEPLLAGRELGPLLE